MKRFAVPLLTVLAMLLVPGSALARGDGWSFVPASSTVTSSCGTRVANDVLANKEYAKVATPPDGSFLIVLLTGVFKVRLTNLEGDQSFVVNASGTGHNAVFFANGAFLFTARGPALITLTADQAADAGLPEIFLNKGNMRLLFGADGSAQLLSRTGRLVDLCARLTA